MESRFDPQGNWSRPAADIEKHLLAEESRQILLDCLKTVSPAQRAALYLREWEELKTPEICKKLGITVTNLGVLLFRARNRLRECVEKRSLKGA